ncbi:MAG: formate dehydrogenase accessory protein FdhE [Chloroflexi bacterium]|nr:formate dehydrogenase accessory protein FdhE [Chloroflexota bacterium]
MKTVSNVLAEAAQRDPGMANYYDLHRALLELQDEAQGEIAATLELADKEALQARLIQKLPLISFAHLPIEAARFARLAGEIAQTLTEYEVELGEQSLPAADDEWVSLAQQRFEQGQVSEEQSEEPEVTTLAQAAADLALQPYLAWAAERALPYVDQEHWKQGYCPVCGGAPDFATLDEEAGARHLLCSRCNSQWVYRRVGCPFCGTTDHTKLSYYPSDDEVYRLYVCQECRRYLKTVDLRKAKGEILLPAERVTTIAMDAAARQEGYR